MFAVGIGKTETSKSQRNDFTVNRTSTDSDVEHESIKRLREPRTCVFGFVLLLGPD